ncbi:hypothetical protein L1987_55520 [Smallanthus sonchifolius]|uniref:Uncharacterized protein n=1 Tax=Smallanthus sonchifolius TaxID=185202 RepID=A0ACB9E9U4_9ASTR|nr:hypothetical protein L1987_55520 [Smallanthus sonchifolius]
MVAIVVIAIVIALIGRWGWKVLNWAWLKPKKLEKWLTDQGYKGNSYKLTLSIWVLIFVDEEEAKLKSQLDDGSDFEQTESRNSVLTSKSSPASIFCFRAHNHSLAYYGSCCHCHSSVAADAPVTASAFLSPGGSSHGRALGRQSESSPRGSSHGRGRGHQLESSRGGISHGRGRGHQLESSPGGISHGRGRADTSYGGGGSRPGGQGDLLGDMDTTLQPDFRYGFETTTDHVQSHDGDGFDGDGFDGEDSGGGVPELHGGEVWGGHYSVSIG